MKHTAALLLIFVLFACSKKEADQTLHLSGTVKGLKKGTLYIRKIKDSSLVSIDTIRIDGSSDFTSDLHIESPEMYYLFLDRGASNTLDNNLPFFAEAGNLRIETTLDHFLSDAKITGSKNHAKYEEFKKVTTRYNDQNLALTEMKFHAFKDKNFKKVDSISSLQNANMSRRYLYTTNFALTNRDYEVAPYVTLSEISNINLKYLDTIRKSMAPKVAKSLYGMKLIRFYDERIKSEKK